MIILHRQQRTTLHPVHASPHTVTPSVCVCVCAGPTGQEYVCWLVCGGYVEVVMMMMWPSICEVVWCSPIHTTTEQYPSYAEQFRVGEMLEFTRHVAHTDTERDRLCVRS